jgi:hypothetical protein
LGLCWGGVWRERDGFFENMLLKRFSETSCGSH